MNLEDKNNKIQYPSMLVLEGCINELICQINNTRKQLDYNILDRIDIKIATDSLFLMLSIYNFDKTFISRCLIDSMEIINLSLYRDEIDKTWKEQNINLSLGISKYMKNYGGLHRTYFIKLIKSNKK